jgi:hypothetical protein
MYYADDKDVQDLLMAAKQKLGNDRLLAIARQRGIYLSRMMIRENLVEYLKCLTFNWPQLRALVEATDSPDRVERSTCTDVRGTVEQARLLSALDQLKKERSESHAEAVQVTSNKTGNHTISVDYSELDPSKMRLFQRKAKHLKISVEQHPDGLRLRYDDNLRAHEIVEKLLNGIVESTDKTPVNRIDLSGVRKPARRTQFFVDLMTKMNGFRLDDVTCMGVSRLSDATDAVDEDAAPNDDEAEDDNLDVERTLSTQERELVGVVKKAALEGSNLLSSSQFKGFEKADFFICRSTWVATEESGQRRRVEFDARFSDPPDARGFTYKILATFEPMKGGHYRRAQNFSTRDPALLTLLEDTARQAADDAARPQED